MQSEIDAVGPRIDAQILGINETGYEAGNAAMCQGRQIPWLQETAQQRAWMDWNVTFRDVIILDEGNVKAAVFNVTTYNLAYTANYDSLKSLLLQLAQ